jgi:hypothetical protein
MGDELDDNGADRLALALRAGLGLVPVLGSILAEVITVTIPNQRIDRIAMYIEQLSKRLESLESQHTLSEKGLASLPPVGLALLEDGARTSARALSSERIEQIALVVSRGLGEDEQNMQNERELVAIIDQMSDRDVSFLMMLQFPVSWRLGELKAAISYGPEIDSTGTDREQEYDQVVWNVLRHKRWNERQLMVQKIQSLGIINKRAEKRTDPSQLDSVYWPVEAHDYEISGLGRYVLWRMGLASNGIGYIDGQHVRPDNFYEALTDEAITLMLDYIYQN